MAQRIEPYRRLPPEWNGVVPTKVFLDEAFRIVQKSKEYGVTLRVMGGVGIALRCQAQADFAGRLRRTTQGNQEYTDLDFAGLFGQRGKLVDFFKTLSYEKRPTTISTSTSQRQIYFHPDGYFTVDVLMDKLLIANHPIDFRKRIEVDGLTLSLADLLLEKIQMWVSFSEKDLKDCLLLLKAHDLSQDRSEGESINAAYIADLLSDDWGFYYTATNNLKKMVNLINDHDTPSKQANIDPSLISADDRDVIASRIQRLLKTIEDRPKSFGWRMRAKLGTSKQWYRTVETPATVGDFGIWKLREVKNQ